MKKLEKYEIITNQQIADKTYKMKLKGDGSWNDKPGKFINITVDNCYLKRPISICDCDDDNITIIYKVVGQGTKHLSTLKEKTVIEALTDLGNGFDILADEKVLVVGGGVGIPPLLGLSKKLKKLGKEIHVVLGFNTKNDIFLVDEFKEITDNVYVCTNDGSAYHKGNVIDIIKKFNLDLPYYTCGPKLMLKAITDNLTSRGLISLEERMGCGFGACMGCTHKTKDGYKRVCVEGPVFKSEEIIWKD